VSEKSKDHESAAIRAAVSSAIADVDSIGVSASDRPMVLEAVLAKRLGLNAGAFPALDSSAGKLHTKIEIGEGGVMGKIATRMKLSADVLELVYDIRDGQPNLVISGKKLPSNKAQATKLITQLVAGSRQAAEIDEWTSVGTIRAAITEYGRLDSSNFAATIQQLDSVLLIRGKGLDREVKVTKPGMEEIAAVIGNLVKDVA